MQQLPGPNIVMTGISSSLDRRLDLRTEWALATALRAMSACSLEGPSPPRLKAVVDHLRLAADSAALPPPVRDACEEALRIWESPQFPHRK